MNTELRNEYDTIQEILVKLYGLLEEAKQKGNADNSVKVILDSINSVKKDEKELLKKIRKSIYMKYTKEDIEEYEKQVEIEKRKEEEKKKEEIKLEFDDAKVVFDGDYKLVYSNGTKVISKRLDRYLLDKNIDFAYDYNICDLLRTVDEENGTNLYRRYRYGQLEVIYNFYNNKKVDRKAFKQLKKISKETSERYENVSVTGVKKRTLKGVLATTAVAAMVGLSTLGITSIFKKNNNSSATKNTYSVSNEMNNSIEVPKEESTVKLTKADIMVEETNKDYKNVQDNVKKKVNEYHIVNDTEEIVKNTQSSVITKINTKEEKLEEKETDEFSGLEIGSTMELPDMDLYYSSTSDEVVGNTKYLRAHTGIYKIDLVSIVYKGRCLEVIKNEGYDLDQLKEYVKETYGDDIKISVNLDVINEEGKTIYKNVGWVNSEIFSKKSNVKSLVMNK